MKTYPSSAVRFVFSFSLSSDFNRLWRLLKISADSARMNLYFRQRQTSRRNEQTAKDEGGGRIEEKDTAEVLSRLFIKGLSGEREGCSLPVPFFASPNVTRKCKFQIAFIRPAGNAHRGRRRKDVQSLRPMTTDRNGSSGSTNSLEVFAFPDPH